MSKRQQRKAKQQRRANQRAHQARRRPPTLAEIAGEFIAPFADDLLDDDLLMAELAMSDTLVSSYREAMVMHANGEEAPCVAMPIVQLIDNVHPAGPMRDAALALALLLVTYDPRDIELAARCGVLVERLVEAGGVRPSWAGDIGAWQLGECWVVRDVWCEQEQVLLQFTSTSGSEEHVVGAMIDRTEGHQLVEIEAFGPLEDLLTSIRTSLDGSDDADLMVLEQVPAARAGGMLEAALQASWDEAGEALLETDAIERLGLLETRYELLLPLLESASWEAKFASPMSSELDELLRDDLVEQFVTSPEFAAEVDAGASREAAVEIVEWVHGVSVERPATFGPSDAAAYLLVDLPSSDIDEARREAPVEPTLATVRAWARFAARHAQHDEAAVHTVLETIATVGARHADAMLHGADDDDEPFDDGPAARLVAQMQAEGVDPTDPRALDAWMHDFNSRSLDDRDRVLGPMPSPLPPS